MPSMWTFVISIFRIRFSGSPASHSATALLPRNAGLFGGNQTTSSTQRPRTPTVSLASSYPSQCCWTAMIACWTRFDASLTGLPFEQLHRQNGVVLHIVKPSAHELVLEALGVKEGGTATGAGRVLGPEHRDTLMSMNNLANMLFVAGRYDEA